MESLLDKLKAGTANRKALPWPGLPEAVVHLHVLSDQDQLEAGMAADRIYRDAKIDVAMANINDYEAEKTTQLLYRAVRDPSTGGRICPDIESFRRLLTKGAREALVHELNQLTQECSPPLDTMTQEQYDSIVESVKKNPQIVLNHSSICLLRKLVMSLAAQLASLQAANGST